MGKEEVRRETVILKNKGGAKMKRWLIFLALTGLLFWAPQAKASKEEMYILLNLLVEKGTITKDESKEIMTAVENIAKKQKQDAEKNSIKTAAAKNMKIGGYGQIRYDNYEYKGKIDEFYAKRVRAAISGDIIDNVAYKIEFDLVKGKNNDLLTDAWVKFTHFPQANITLGQFKIPYSEEYLTSSSALDTIERSLPVGKISQEYDRGIMVSGDLFDKIVNYGVALVNGAGPNTSDDNESKDIVARLVFSPWAKSSNALSGLMVATAYQTGEQKTGANAEDRVRNVFTLKYNYKNFRALAEYLTQDVEKKATNVSTKSDGYFVQVAYNFPLSNSNSIEPVLKYEVYDPNTKVSKNTQTIFTTGLNYYLGKNVKFSTNYRWRSDDKGGKIETNSNEWFSQVQIKY
ncbi:MAG: porin [Candidatus Omnitrophica bacterium]|nr:porin [Candidatus Omnitrophota bacterium]MCM8827864.1 porin [Candidatus Omnitrophota bacterium]